MIRICCRILVISLLWCWPARAQELHTGDRVPAAAGLTPLYEKGGLLVDFWATWCGPCVSELGMVDSLAARFPKLAVLAVSHDDSLKTFGFLKQHREIPTAHLHVTSNDKVLSAWFPHKTLPHLVWIDRSGVVRLITGGYSVNDRNVAAFLRDSMPAVKVKAEDTKFDFRKPYHVADSALEYRSIFSRHKGELGSGVVFPGATGSGMVKRLFAFNCDLVNLYWLAFTGMVSERRNWHYIELHTSDSTRFFFPEENKALFSRSTYAVPGTTYAEQRENWLNDHLYCYELRLPAAVPTGEFGRYLLEDLNRFFPVRGSMEQRRLFCPVMLRGPGFDARSFRQAEPQNKPAFVRTAQQLTVNGRTLNEVIAYLAQYYDFELALTPLINETGIDYPVDLQLAIRRGESVADIYRELARKRLVFKQLKRKVPVLVLRDK